MSHPLNLLSKKEPEKQNELWYAQGLKFKCTECGKCCTGAPGYVWVTEDEISQMAEHFKISSSDVKKRYTRHVNGKLALVEKSVTYDCIFLKERKCSIYQVRPKQCRTFPWWPYTLKSEENWKEAATYCEGIHNDAPIVSIETIQKQLAIQES